MEKASASRDKERSVEISIRFLGAYNDRHLILRFPSVRSYIIKRPLRSEKRQKVVGHGDVLEDAINIGDQHHVVYSLRLEFGLIEIESKDIEFSEELL